MTNRELKKLTRAELLEMLLVQSREKQHLVEELQEVKQNLEKKEIMIAQAGSIAEASLRLNRVFEAAQKAADQYLENVKRMAAETGRIKEQGQALEADVQEQKPEAEAESQGLDV